MAVAKFIPKENIYVDIPGSPKQFVVEITENGTIKTKLSHDDTYRGGTFGSAGYYPEGFIDNFAYQIPLPPHQLDVAKQFNYDYFDGFYLKFESREDEIRYGKFLEDIARDILSHLGVQMSAQEKSITNDTENAENAPGSSDPSIGDNPVADPSTMPHKDPSTGEMVAGDISVGETSEEAAPVVNDNVVEDRVENPAEFIDRSRAWDPRINFRDGILLESDVAAGSTDGGLMAPFSSYTAMSAFKDRVYTAPKAFFEAYNKVREDAAKALEANEKSRAAQEKENLDKKKAWEEREKKREADLEAAKKRKEENSDYEIPKELEKAEPEPEYKEWKEPETDADKLNNLDTPTDWEKINYNLHNVDSMLYSFPIDESGAPTARVKRYFEDGNYYGVKSLMNPYSITMLCNSLISPRRIEDGYYGFGEGSNKLFDVRDSRRFYSYEEENSEDIFRSQEPTTTNIITYSCRDSYGRTPYSFQDFVFCKWWNVIPNNRLITLRKYSTPVNDNLTFYQMSEDTHKDVNESKQAYAPIATVVTYFGEQTENVLSDLLTFVTGVEWEDLEAEVWSVSGQAGSNANQVIDDMIQSGNIGADYIEGPLKSVMSYGNFLPKKWLQMAKGLSMFDSPKGFDPHAANAEKLNSALQDPYENGPLSNKILGPVNAIKSVKKRKQGIQFENSLKIKCTYVARSIGGINTKAAMLDILSNAMLMGSANAMFWGGGHRYDVTPSNSYPWSLGDKTQDMMSKMAQGKLFGRDGVIGDALRGILQIGTDANGNFNFANVVNSLSGAFKEIFSGIGNLLASGINSVLGTSIDLFQSEDDKKNGDKIKNTVSEKLGNMTSNLNNMVKAEVIKNTTYPQVSGMRAILTGEPVGNWHLTIGNPLNPIAVIGNLICNNVEIKFNDELGPDDFPTELYATYTLEHGMYRDFTAIMSVFNRGAGKIYSLPDYINATSNYETKVDANTGNTGSTWKGPQFVGGLMGAKVGKSYDISPETPPTNHGDPATTKIPKFGRAFADIDDYITPTSQKTTNMYSVISKLPVYRAGIMARKEQR